MAKNNKKQAPCSRCVADITMGFFFQVCNDSLSDKINCKSLNKKFLHGEISAEKVIQKIKAAAQNNPEATSDLTEIEKIRRMGKP